jgi:hypothetical protein
MKQIDEYGATVNTNKFGASESRAFQQIEKPTNSLRNTIGGSVVRDVPQHPVKPPSSSLSAATGSSR